MFQNKYLLCAFPALSSALLASNGATSADPAISPNLDPTNGPGVPALFSWGDIDGDGHLDLATVGDGGTLRLLINTGEGRFEDVTERLGLSGVGNAALALWADYDGDGRLDLFVGARKGASRLFHNEDGVFVDMSVGSGLVSEGAVESAQWFDHDGDGRPDLFVVTAEKSELYRGLEGGFFERVELPFGGFLGAPGRGGSLADAGELSPQWGGPLGEGTAVASDSPRSGKGSPVDDSVLLSGNRDGVSPPSGRIMVGPSPSGGSAAPILAGCFPAIRDQASPGGPCIRASTTPTLGRLYPITSNLFVAVGGNVGIGTTSPTARLHVAGTARMTDTLTLAPGGDQALDVSTGSIYKGGALFIHTKGGLDNTAVGLGALTSVTSGTQNTAAGDRALTTNTTGFNNTAFGAVALRDNTSGPRNTAVGVYALSRNTTADNNTAIGTEALRFNTTGRRNSASGDNALRNSTMGSYNTASGYAALRDNSTGSSNIAIGNQAGVSLTTGSNNIAIGNSGVAGEGGTIRMGTAGSHTMAFIAGIRGVTTVNANAIPVLIDSAGQLGTVSSSRRFKEDIRDMGDATERLLNLRPVLFRYKQTQTLPGGQEVPPEYGLIAEEVAEIFPELVVYDEEGEPFTVKYHLLSSMLLNELQELHERLEAESSEQTQALAELDGLRVAQLRELEARLTELESRATPAGATASSSADSR